MKEQKDIKETFKEEFNKTCELILDRYPNKEVSNRDIIGVAIIRFIHEFQLDVETKSFIEIYKKYLSGTLFLDASDFTKKEKEEIINQSDLKERDRQLAELIFVDNATEQVITNKLGIDRKTIYNNIEAISLKLKQTAAKLYK